MSQVPLGKYLTELARLTRVSGSTTECFDGAQNRPVPAEVDPAESHTVIVWCESCAQYIGCGALERAAAAPAS
jgi:hypothetical protein